MTQQNEGQQLTIRATPVTVGERSHGVIPGTKAAAAASGNGHRGATAEQIRAWSKEEDDNLRDPQFDNGPGGYDEPVSIGTNPWDLYARTRITDEDEAAEFALLYATNVDAMRNQEWFAKSPFAGKHAAVIAMDIELILRKSIDSMSLKEALMGMVGMAVPEWMERYLTSKGKPKR